MAPKLKLRLTQASPPRNSFTMTDYYRTTREEIYSPVSLAESLSPESPYADPSKAPPARLEHIREHPSDEGETGEDAERRVKKRAAMFLHVFQALFRKWRRQKARAGKFKVA